MTSSNIKLIYMSGTGNTAWVTRRLTEHLRSPYAHHVPLGTPTRG